MGISTNPKTFTEGLFDDMTAEVKEAKFVLYDYDGKRAESVPCFMLDLLPDDSKEGKSYKQYWSCGAAKDFVPSKDGKELLPVGTRSSLSASCNFALLCRSMLEAGVPEELVGGLGSDTTLIVGAKLHLTKQTFKRKIGGEDKADSVLIVESVVALPGEKGKGKGKGKAVVAKDGKTAKDRDLEADTMELVEGILKEQDSGTLDKKKLPAQIFNKTQDQDVMDLAFTDEFLADKSRPWTFKDGTLALKD